MGLYYDHSNAMQKTTIKKEIGFIKIGSTNKQKYSYNGLKIITGCIFFVQV